jgi:cell division protein FtsL
MIKPLITIIFVFSFFNSFGQIDSVKVNKEFRRLNIEIQNLKNENNTLSKRIQQLNATFNKRNDSLLSQISLNTNNIQATANKLGFKIDESTNNSFQKIREINTSISNKSLYWIIGLIITILLVLSIYFFLRKKITDGNSVLDKQISVTKKALEEEGIKLDTKLTEVLETQLKLLNVERSIPMNTALVSEEIDHSLALKVADEIVRIQKNLSNMDSNTKGLKQLAASVKRIQDNFEANGYEVAELLNKPYNSGLRVIVVNSMPDENLKLGEEVITRIIKPQVNYKGIMIQSAQVEVSVG